MIVALLLGTLGVVAAAPATVSGCETDWGSIQKISDESSFGHVAGVRTGRHGCFDRLVIDVHGPRPGYHVSYVDTVRADGSGDVVPVDGGAVLQIIARAPAHDEQGRATVDPAAVSGTDVTGHQTFRDVEWAGSFEGQSTIGLGVRARLPFRVFTLDGPGVGSRMVIDVAHSWNTPPPSDDEFPSRAGDELGVIGVAHDDVLNLRSGPGTNNGIVATVAPTDSVFATGKARALSRSTWYEVSTRGGTKGWASARHLSIPGATEDVTASYLAQHDRPSAETMTALGEEVARDFLPSEQGSFIAMSVGPTVGDLGEVTYDVVGLADDSVRGVRLHIFAEPHDSGDGFELRTIEATFYCDRGFDGTSCV